MQLQGHLLILHLLSDGARVVALGVDASLLGGALGVAGAAHTYTQERQMIKCGLSGVFQFNRMINGVICFFTAQGSRRRGFAPLQINFIKKRIRGPSTPLDSIDAANYQYNYKGNIFSTIGSKHCGNQCCGSGSKFGPHSEPMWNQNCIPNTDPDPDKYSKQDRINQR